MKVTWNELDLKLTVDITIAVIMFLVGMFWDGIAQAFLLRHSTEGFPLLQMAWCSFWAVYGGWSYWYMIHYGR